MSRAYRQKLPFSLSAFRAARYALSKIDTYSDKLLHGRSSYSWRSAAAPWHYDAVEVRPSTPSRVETLLRNHADGIAAMDIFVVPPLSFRLLYGLLILWHGRRQILWLGVTAHPTAEWIARQLAEACGWEWMPSCIVRDRDFVYGDIFTRWLRAMGIRDRPIAPRSPWQNGHAERLIGSLRRGCLDLVVVLGERHLAPIWDI
jgi:hypothetical protein